ncbi:MAG: SusC/RagA family TonB-linked outer membrane protein, partial [Bacteroidetes bacterium]
MKRVNLLLAFLFIMGMFVVHAQTTISGTVLDDNGEAVPGANIRVKGYSDVGTISDLNGAYTLSVPAEATTLVFSFVGMQTQEVEISGQTTINVTLQNEDVGLEEVVVTAFGIEREKKALGYSVGVVDNEGLSQKPEVDFAASLSGKVAGVDIVKNSGAIGAGSSITIRGSSSINTSNQPLFVVDGVPFDAGSNQLGLFSSGGGNTNMNPSRFLDIDPNNIESVSVLKGLSAASLYGEQGRNGVILITTKTGSKKKSKGMVISVNQSFYMNQVAQLPEYQNSYGQGGDNVTNVGYAGNWGAPFSDNLMVRHHYDQGRFATVFPEYQDLDVPYEPFENNVADFFRKGYGSNTYLNIASGFENGNVNFSAGYTDEDGYIPANNIKKFNAGLGTNFTSGKFHFSSNMNFANTKYKTPPMAARNAANAVTIMERLLYIPRNLDLTGLPYQNPFDGSSVYYRTDQENPYWLVDNSSNSNNTDRFYGNVNATYDILDILSVSYKIGLDTYTDNERYHINKGGVSSVYADNGYFREMMHKNVIFNQDLLFSLDNVKITEDIDISAVAGLQIRSERYTRGGLASTGQVVFDVLQHDNFLAAANVDPLTGSAIDRLAEKNLIGVYGQATLDFRDYVYLSLTGRNDWGSTVEKENRSLFYPSASLAFVPTSAFENLQSKYLNFMKIRFAYATSAGYPGVYSTRSSYVLTPQAFDGGGGPDPSIAASAFLGNPNLRPELHKEFEIGFEGNFVENRISLEATYYNKISEDQILDKRLDPSTGYRVTSINLGRVDAYGVEVNLGITPVRNDKVVWTINNIFSMHRSKVIDTGGDRIMFAGFTNEGNFAIEGEPLGVIVGNYSVRDSVTGSLLINATDGHTISSDDLGYDTEICGDPEPDFKYNMINSVSFMGFTLYAQIDYTHGGDIASNTVATLLRRGVTKDTEDREGTYIIPGVLANPNSGEILLDAQGNPIQNNIQIGLNNVHFLNMNDETSG